MGTSSRPARTTLALTVATVLVATLLVFEAPGASAEPEPTPEPAPGQIDTFAGTGATGRGGDGGPATDAQLERPSGLAVDAAGNVYVAQRERHVIRRIDAATGTITTVAGDGNNGDSGDGGPATAASLSSPHDVAIGPDGALYVADTWNHAIRRVDLATGIIDTVVSRTKPFTETTHPDNFSAGYVLLPGGLAFGPDGAIYATSCGPPTGGCGDIPARFIRRIDMATSQIGTYAGEGPAGYAGDGGDRLDARFSGPLHLAFDGGDLLVVDRSNHRVRRIDGATGVVSTLTGLGRSGWERGDGLPAAESDVTFAWGIAVGPDGSVYVSNNSTVKRIDPDGIAGTIAGLGPSQGDGGPSVLSQITPGPVAVLPDGRILVGQNNAHRVRVITPGLPPDAPAGVAASAVDDATLQVDVSPAVGLARLHDVRIDPADLTRRIDEVRNSTFHMPQAVLLDPSMTRSTTFTDIDAGQVTTVEARAHNGWGFGPWRTVSLAADPDPDDPTCRWAVGIDGSWHDPARWSCGGEQRVPTIDDDVVIDVEPEATSFTVTMASNAEARSLVLGGDDTGRTQRHRIVMTDGISTDPRTLTLDTGPFVVRRSGMLTTGRPTVFGVFGQRGWLGRITGPDSTPIEMVVHGFVEGFNMELTGNLTLDRPPDVTEGDRGYMVTRGATFATGSIDIGPGGQVFVVVYRGEEPDTFPRPPRFAAHGGDLTIAAGGNLQLWLETDSTAAAFDGQIAVATPDGRVVNHGLIRSYGRSNAGGLDWTMTIDGPVVNHGRIITTLQGLRLGGPSGTVHTNSGEIAAGDRSHPNFGEIGGPVVVNTGITLVNSGSIEIDRTRRLHGTVANQGGTVSRTTLVSFDEAVDLGLDDPQPTVDVTHDGSARPVTITWYGSPHPYADADERVDGSEQWWSIDVDPDLGTTSLTLPLATDRDDPVLCRHLPGDDANPTIGWDCLDPDVVTPTTLTVDPQGALVARTEWAIGGTPVPDEPEPYAFELFDADETGPDLLNAVLLGQLASAVYRFACGPVVCDDGVDPSNAEWFAAFEALADDWRFSDPAFHTDPLTDAQAVSVRTDGALLVAFRGTEGVFAFQDVAADLNAAPIPVVIGELGTVVVHAGFWLAVDSIYASILEEAEADPDRPIWVAGHSLGGAMAPLLALRLHAEGFDVRGVHTFGAPQMGGLGFDAVYGDSGLDASTHHWVNDRDVITKLLDGVYSSSGRIHVLTRTSESDELAFDLALDAGTIPGWDGWGIEDHDITRTVRRLHSLLDADTQARLPAPYADPPAGPPPPLLSEILELLVLIGTAPEVIVQVLDATLTALERTVEFVVERLVEVGATLELVLAVVEAMFDATVEQIVAAIVAVLDQLGVLAERIRELLLALQDRFGTTAEELVEWLEGLDLDPELLAELTAILLAEVVDRLVTALDTLFLRMTAWLESFGIDPSLLPPLVPSDLAALLDLEALLASIAEQVRAPLVALRDAGERELDALVAELQEIAGITIRHAELAGFPPPQQPGDLLEIEWRVPLDALVDDLQALQDQLAGRLDGLLDGLADQIDEIDVLAGELLAQFEVVLVVGLDADGAYVAAGTEIGLGLATDAGAGIDIGASIDGLGGIGISASGRVELDLALAVAPAIEGRVRLDDEGALDGLGAGVSLSIGVDSTASTTVELGIDNLALTWRALAAFDPPTLGIGVEASVGLPGFLDDAGETLTVPLVGERVGDTWVLSGDLPLPDPFEFEIDGVRLARVEGGDVAAAYTVPGDDDPTLELRLTADALVVLPDVGADGAVRIDDLDAELGADGSFELTIDELDLDLAGGLVVSMTDVAVALTADEQRPVLTAAEATFEVPGLGLSGSITDLRVDRSGAITALAAGGCLDDLDGVLADLAGFLPFSIGEICLQFEPGDDGRVWLDRFTLTATGALDLSLLEGALGDDVTIEVRLGDAVITDPDAPVTIDIEVLSTDPLTVVPVGASALTISISSLDIGPFTFGAEIAIESIDGEPAVTGTSSVSGPGLDAAGTITGTVDAAGGHTVDVVLAITTESNPDLAGVDVADLELSLVLLADRDDGLRVASLAGGGRVVVPVGDGPTLSIPLSMSWVDGVFTLTGALAVDGTLDVAFDGTTVLTIDDPVLTLGYLDDGAARVIEIGLAAAGFELLPELDVLRLTGTGVGGTVSSTGGFSLGADDLSATLADAFTLDVDGLTITVGPGPDDAVVLSAAAVTATLDGLGVGVDVTDLVVRRDGTVSVEAITVRPGELEETLGIAGLFPFRLDDDGVEIVFVDQDDPLAGFTIVVNGVFDTSRLDDLGESLGFTPILTIGDRTLGGDSDDDGRFTFSVLIDPAADIPVRPVDLPPITLGFDDLTVGPLTFGATITVADLHELQPTVTGTLRLAGGLDDLTGDLEVTVSGSLSSEAGTTTLALQAGLVVSGSFGEIVAVEDLAVDASIALSWDGANLVLTPPTLGEITYEQLEIGIPDLVTFTSEGGTLDLGAGPGELLAEFSGERGLGIRFGDGAGPLQGWGGSVTRVGLQMQLIGGLLVPVPVLLPGFAADLELPDDLDVGFPDWLPLDVRSVGFTLPDELGLDLDALRDLDPGTADPVEFGADLLDGLRLRLSGGLQSTDLVPITADVEGLELDIRRLIDCALAAVPPPAGTGTGTCENPITDLSGIAGGVEPFALGPLTIGGVFGVGLVPVRFDDGSRDDVFYVRIAGEFTYSGIGAGIDLVISEYGPVLARVTVPLAIPLAQTTLLLTGVNGGIQFGGDGLAPPDDPVELVADPRYTLDFPITLGEDGTIAEAVGACAWENRDYDWSQLPQLPPCFTWNDGGTIFLGATLTSYAAPGLISGDVTLAADLRLDADGGLPDLRFAGNGNVNVFGFPIGTAGFLIALDDPLAPMFDVAFRAPGGQGNPLGFLLPARGDVSMRIDTTGIALGSLLATRAFLEAMADGSLELAGDVFDDALAQLAARLDTERHLLLTRQLLDHPAIADDTVITVEFLLDRLLGRNGVPGLLPDEIPTDTDELRALLIEVADVLSALQEALFSQVAALADTAEGLGLDLGGFADDPLYLLNAANELVGPEEAAALAAYGRFAQDVLRGAIADAGSAFSEEFDPRLVITGELQPMLLGVPMGEPTEQITFAVSRESAVLSARTSPSTMFFTVFNAATATLAQLNAQFGLSETLEIGAQLPLDGVVDTLFDAGPLAIDPFSPEWSVTVEAGLRLAGLEIGSLSGIVVGPDNETLLCTKVHKVWETGPARCAPDGIPVTSADRYATILEHGGILVTAQLRAPDLVVDPVATIDELIALIGEPPENLLDYPAWITSATEVVRGIRDVGSLQLFVPGFTNLIDPNDEDGLWTVDYLDGVEADRFNFTAPLAEVEQRLLDVIADAYVDGVWDVRLLGIDLARGTLAATPTGYEVEAEVPFLADPVTFRLGGSEVTVGRDEVFLPSALLDVELDSGDVTALLAAIGAPSILEVPGSADGRLRVATPGYDLDSDDPLLVRGGVGARLRLDLPPFTTGAEFDVVVFPPPGAPSPFTAGGPVPDFVATASVGTIGPLAGVTIADASIEVRRLDGETSVRITGTVETGGAVVGVDAQLADDLTGTIDLTGGGGPLVVGGFTISGGARLELTRARATSPLTVTFRSDLTVTLPQWLSALVGTGTVEAEGTVSTDGSFDVTLLVDQLALPGTGLSIVGPSAGQPVGLRFARLAGGVAEIAVEGRLSGASGLPLLDVDGTWTVQGTGALDVAFPAGGLTLGAFSVSGGAAITRSGSTWSVAVDGRLSVNPLFSEAVVTGAVTSAGIQELSVGVTSFSAGALNVTGATLRLVRQAGGGYVLTATGNVAVPNMGTTTAFTGSITSGGDVAITLATTSRSIHGLTVSSGTFALAHSQSSGTTSVTLSGSATLAGQTASVNGTLDRVGNRWVGDLAVEAPSLSIGGVTVTGSFTVAFTSSTDEPASTIRLVVDGSLTIPGLATTTATGTMTTAGFGELDLTVSQLQPAGSPFRFDGTFRFRRTSGFLGVTRFESSNATLTWQDGGTTFTLPTFHIATDGSMSVTTAARSVTKNRIQLSLPAASFTTGPSASNPTLSIGATTISVTGVFGPLTLQGFTVGIDGSLSTPLTTTNVSIGGLQLQGDVRLEKSGTTWQLRVGGTGSYATPRLTVPGIAGTILLDDFVIASNSTFDITASSRQIGSDTFRIRNATIRFRKLSQTGAVTVRIDSGAELLVSRLQPIPLPTLTFSDQGAISQSMNRVLDFGPMLRRTNTPETVPLVLESTSNGLQLRLTSARNFRVLNSTLSLQSFTARNGHFSGTLSGSLTLPIGNPNVTLASGTFNISGRTQDGVPITRLTIPASSPLSIGVFPTGSDAPTGPASATAHGWVESTGRYRFELDATVDLTATILGFQLGAAGSISGQVRNNGLRNGEFSGTICAGFCATGTRTVQRSTGTIATFDSFPRFPVVRPIPVGPDLAPPQLGPVADIDVTAPVGSTSMFVEVPLPPATDDRDPSPVVTCDRASGQFSTGTHTVTCTARDDTGKVSSPRSFTITVRSATITIGMVMTTSTTTTDTGSDSSEPLVSSGDTMTITATGYDDGSAFTGKMYSEPVVLGMGFADRDGVARLTFTVPDLPPGPHTIVLEGRAPDGGIRIVAATVILTGSPTVPGFPGAPADAPTAGTPVRTPPTATPTPGTPDAPADPGVTPLPIAELPATGTSGTPWTLTLAAIILAIGAVLRASGNHRRRARLRSPVDGGSDDRGRRPRSVDGGGARRRRGRDAGAVGLGEDPCPAGRARPRR